MPHHIESASGQVVWRAVEIDAYGSIIVDSKSTIDYHLRWPGHRFDQDTGLHYNRYRDYDPKLGRYIEPDPLGHAGGINLYAYSKNPMVDVDLLGLLTLCDLVRQIEAVTGRPIAETPVLLGHAARLHSRFKGGSISENEARAHVEGAIQDNAHLIRGGGMGDAIRQINLGGAEDAAAMRLALRGENVEPPLRHSRETEFNNGYRQRTHETMIRRHTDEGRKQNTGRPVDANGNPIPRRELTWLNPQNEDKPFPPGTDVTYDHEISLAKMFNDGAELYDPETDSIIEYPAGRATDRATRNNFANDTHNLSPLGRRENSSKGADGRTYNELPTIPPYSR